MACLRCGKPHPWDAPCVWTEEMPEKPKQKDRHKKTEARAEYMRNYMREYMKSRRAKIPQKNLGENA